MESMIAQAEKALTCTRLEDGPRVASYAEVLVNTKNFAGRYICGACLRISVDATSLCMPMDFTN